MKSVSISELCQMNLSFSDLEVFPEAWIRRKKSTLYKRIPRPSCALFFVCSDIQASFYEKNVCTVTAQKGDIVFIPRGICYHVETEFESQQTQLTYTVNFRLFDQEHQEIFLSDAITVLTKTTDPLLELHAKRLSDAVRGMDSQSPEGGKNLLKIQALFYTLLDAVVQSAAEYSEIYYPIRKGVAALFAEWNQNEKMEKYAQLCGVSNSYFYQCFRKWSGKSPNEYRNQIRLTNAETMLRHTDMPISAVSEAVGFSDSFYFCRIFSRHYGMSPQKYRQMFWKG